MKGFLCYWGKGCPLMVTKCSDASSASLTCFPASSFFFFFSFALILLYAKPKVVSVIRVQA